MLSVARASGMDGLTRALDDAAATARGISEGTKGGLTNQLYISNNRLSII